MSSFTGETKAASTPTPKPTPPTSTTNASSSSTSPTSMILLQPELIPNEYKTVHGITEESRVDNNMLTFEDIWLNIYSFLQPSYLTRLGMKCLCRLFNDVEKKITLLPTCSPLEPIPRGSYTSFPHPKYATLRKLTNRLNKLNPLPTLLFIANGVYDERGKVVMINIPISIFGESKEGVQIIGGFYITGKKEADVFLSDCTVTGAKMYGVNGNNGAAVHLKNVCVEKCGKYGIFVLSTERNTMTDCNVNNNKKGGVCVYGGGCMTIDGSATTIHHNGTDGNGDRYGLYAWCSSSSIHLKSLTESISTNNGDDGNYGGDGTIDIVDNKGTVVETIQEGNNR